MMKKENKKKLIEEMNLKIEKETDKTNEKKRLIKEELIAHINKNIKKNEDDFSKKEKPISVNNVEIPECTHTWRNQKLPELSSIFIDELFTPSKQNLCKINNLGQWEFPEDVDENDLINWDNIKWERVEEIFMSKNYQVFYDKIEKEDIIQGNLGNCYFLSALASLCKYPNLIEKLFFFKEKSEEHCYGCYFRINGIWKLVLLDDFFPCCGSYKKNFAFSHTNGNELWVILLEKAWAKLNGNYARIIGGDPHEIFEVLTNAYCEKFIFNEKDKEEIWLKYKIAQEKGFLMTAGTNCDENLNIEQMGLVPGHAYTIVKVLEVVTNSGKQKLINLRNPWGHGEWSGDWCDSSIKWTKDIRNQCNNYEIQNDGSFWMSFEDFYKFFIIGGICHLYQNYHYSFLHIFKETAIQGAFISKLIINENNTHCFLMAHQKNPRVILRDKLYQKPVLFYLILIDSNYEYISSVYKQEKNINIEITLNKGIYYMISDINYRFVQNVQHGYTLSCYSSSPVEIIMEKNLNIEKSFKTALFTYSKKYLNPRKNKGGLIYKIKKINKDFPFSFVLFDNTEGYNDILISNLIKFKGIKNVSYYFENEKNNNSLIYKIILPGQWDLFCCMPHTFGNSYSIQIKFLAKEKNKIEFYKELKSSFLEPKTISNDSIFYENVFKEDWEALDDEGFIRQYIHIDKSNYYLGFENIAKKNVNIIMKINVMKEKNMPIENIIDFVLLTNTKKVFLLNDKGYFFGDIIFSFKINSDENI